jgi:hypothetical protein
MSTGSPNEPGNVPHKPKKSNDWLAFITVAIVGILLIGQTIKRFSPDLWQSFPEIVKVVVGDIGGVILILPIVVLVVIIMGASGMEPSCFVATAVYESKTHPDVLLFKRFRDKFLLKTVLGQIVVWLYYLIGPYLAKLVVWLGLRNLMYRQLSSLASWMRRRYKL